MQKQIVIYSKAVDEFVNNVIDWLDEDSLFVINRNTSLEISTLLISENKPLETVFNSQYSKVESRNIKSIWFNGGVVKINNSSLSKKLDEYNENILNELVISTLSNIQKSIGSVKSNIRTNKMLDLNLAIKNNLVVPNTILTKKKKDLISFVEKYNLKGVICKRINDVGLFFENEFVYDVSKTMFLDLEQIELLQDKFELTLFQEKIEMEFEVRVIFFCNKIYSAAIINSIDNVDYRENLNTEGEPRIIPFKLPYKIKSHLKDFMKDKQLNYGSIDLIYSKNSKYYFLELNPVGQISFINNRCNFNLDEKFAKFLKNEN